MKLDYCVENSHGFWLDAGEDERVIAAMQKRSTEVKRKLDAESEWKQALKGMHGVATYEDIYKLTYVRVPEWDHRHAGRGTQQALPPAARPC